MSSTVQTDYLIMGYIYDDDVNIVYDMETLYIGNTEPKEIPVPEHYFDEIVVYKKINNKTKEETNE